jgi:hypothetical protein
MEELLADSSNVSWAEPDPDNLAIPDCLYSDGERLEVEAPMPVEWATEEAAMAPAEVERVVVKGQEHC